VRCFPRAIPDRACLVEREKLGMNEPFTVRAVRYVAGAIAVLFGGATLFAGGRALAGIDPGYQVFVPLLVYNTVMGFSYVAVGVAMWRSPRLGRAGAHVIFMLNVVVLITIVLVYSTGGAVAVDSLQAMSFRTAVWMVLFLATAWMVRPHADD
jgi:integral membrane sensor domain MASE1